MPAENPITKNTENMLINAYMRDIEPTSVVDSRWAMIK